MDNERITVRELAEELGISKTAVQKRAAALGITLEQEGKRHTRYATPEQAAAIRAAVKGVQASEDEQINMFEIIDDPEPDKAEEPKKKPAEPKRERQPKTEPTAAAIEVLRELLQKQAEQLEQERAQHRADMEKVQEQHAAQLETKDKQIEALQTLLSQSQQLQAMQAAQLKALQAPKGKDDQEAEDGTAQPGAEDPSENAPEQTAPGAADPQQDAGLWERIKAFFRG